MNTPYKAPSIMSAFDHELIIHVIKIHRQVHVHIGEAIAIPSASEVIQKKAIAIPGKTTTSSKNARHATSPPPLEQALLLPSSSSPHMLLPTPKKTRPATSPPPLEQALSLPSSSSPPPP